MESMAIASKTSYQTDDGIERAIIDLIRVGTQGHASGVRQLATRLIRSVPPGINNAEAFRDKVHKAIASGLDSTTLRYTSGTIPTEGDSSQPLAEVDPLPDGDGLTVHKNIMAQLDEIIMEWHRANELRKVNIAPTRTLLLSGPPGVGKTMTAKWIARMLQLPLVTLDLSSAVSSYLGNSGRNIKAVLDYAKSGPCVLLLDEFDAIAKKRGDDSDIGELKRIVNVILLELDRWPDTSLLIAATNHPQLLDMAVERRFDRLLTFEPPDIHQRHTILEHLASQTERVDKKLLEIIAELTPKMTGSDLARYWKLSYRRSILNDSTIADELVRELASTSNMKKPSIHRDKLFLIMYDELKMSTRQIAEIVGVSHPTISASIRRSREAHHD